MDFNGIIIAVVVIGLLGLLVGVFLGIAAIKLRIYVDPKQEEVLNALPGNNCGGCGYAGCAQMAEAIAKGQAPVGGCPVGGDKVAANIAKIMGESATTSRRQVAFVKCNGTCENASKDYDYSGMTDCNMAMFVPGNGPKSCNFGCMGFGTCVKACPFDAINIINGIAHVDEDKCKACGKCVAACPKQIIELVYADSKQRVACASHDKGPDAMKKCKSACIGCGICKKNCQSQAIEVEGFLAHIDYDKCVNCGVCKEKCPKKAII